jgi:hypothetical protein
MHQHASALKQDRMAAATGIPTVAPQRPAAGFRPSAPPSCLDAASPGVPQPRARACFLGPRPPRTAAPAVDAGRRVARLLKGKAPAAPPATHPCQPPCARIASAPPEGSKTKPDGRGLFLGGRRAAPPHAVAAGLASEPRRVLQSEERRGWWRGVRVRFPWCMRGVRLGRGGVPPGFQPGAGCGRSARCARLRRVGRGRERGGRDKEGQTRGDGKEQWRGLRVAHD